MRVQTWVGGQSLRATHLGRAVLHLVEAAWKSGLRGPEATLFTYAQRSSFHGGDEVEKEEHVQPSGQEGIQGYKIPAHWTDV